MKVVLILLKESFNKDSEAIQKKTEDEVEIWSTAKTSLVYSSDPNEALQLREDIYSFCWTLCFN